MNTFRCPNWASQLWRWIGLEKRVACAVPQPVTVKSPMSSQAQTETEVYKNKLREWGQLMTGKKSLLSGSIAGEEATDDGKKSLLSDSIAGEGAVAEDGKKSLLSDSFVGEGTFDTHSHDLGSLYRKTMCPEPRPSQRLQFCLWETYRFWRDVFGYLKYHPFLFNWFLSTELEQLNDKMKWSSLP